MAGYNDLFFGKYPAVTENRFCKGSFIYEGSLVSAEIQMKIVANKAKGIGLVDDRQILYPVVTRSGINNQGKTIRYYLNYSRSGQSVMFKFDKGTELFTNKRLRKGDSLALKPWEFVIVEE